MEEIKEKTFTKGVETGANDLGNEEKGFNPNKAED